MANGFKLGESLSLPSLSPNKVLITNNAGKTETSGITTSELNALSGIQGNIQEQINNKQTTITDRTFNVATTDWIANTDTSTNTDYPYIAVITSSVYSANSEPIWQMGGVGDLPTSTEIAEMGKVAEAIFNTSGITLYATAQPSIALVLSVKGV